MEIIREILYNQATPLDIQRELVDERRALLETTAGTTLSEDLNSYVHRLKSILEPVKSGKKSAGESLGGDLLQAMEEEEEAMQRRLTDTLLAVSGTETSFREEQERARQAVHAGSLGSDAAFWCYFGDDERKQWTESQRAEPGLKDGENSGLS
jgi:hypothetical protein